jgi:Tol biopolymer transport system component
MIRLRTALILCLLATTALEASGQEYFGQNKVKYDDFDWHFIDTEHFTIYFDKPAYAVAEFAAREAERSLRDIEEALGYQIKARYPLIFFNSHNGFSVSNISGQELTEFTGGFTEFAQGRVVMPYTGSYADFRHVIHHELVHVVTIEMWTGGGWLGAMITGSVQLPPLWVAEGIAEYLSQYGWDRNADNLMRDATITGYVPPIQQMTGGLFAYKGGQAVFYMMEQKYGKDKVAQFIRDIKTAKSPQKAAQSALGMSIEELNDEWHLWLKRQHWNNINLHDSPDEIAKAVTDGEQDGGFYNLAPVLSPQGDKIAYLSDQDGTFDIHLRSAIDGKYLGRLAQGMKSTTFEWMFVLRPGITWSPDGREIAFAAKSKNKNTLYTLDVRRRKVTRKFKFDLDGLFEPAWSPDGQQIAFVGLKNGWSDVYVTDVDNQSLHRLTSDPYDEKHLDWSEDGTWLAMSSDRPEPSLDFDGRREFDFGNYDIFAMRTDGSEIRRIEGGEAQETHPVWGPGDDHLAFVSDRNGVANVFVTTEDDGAVKAATNLVSGVLDLDWAADGKKMVFPSFHKGRYDIYALKNPMDKLKSIEDLPLTRIEMRNRGIVDLTYVERDELSRQDAEDEAEALDEALGFAAEASHEEESPDAAGPSIDRWVSDQVAVAALAEEPDLLSIEDVIQAEGEAADPLAESEDDGYLIQKYGVKFKPEIVAAQAGYDTFYGLSGLVQFSLTDLMGDHRLALLTGLNFAIEDSDFYLSYAYLKRQTNYMAALNHQRTYFFSGNQLFADRYFGGALAAEHPFTRFTRLETSLQLLQISRDGFSDALNPFVNGGVFGAPSAGIATHVSTERAIMPSLALVTDNTSGDLYGPTTGHRTRLAVEGSAVGLDYLTVRGDYRTYVEVSPRHSFAFRLSGGTSTGRNRTRFFVGGVNNTLNPTFSTIATVPTNEVFFSEYLWPLRGVDLFSMAGDSYMMSNIAFRFPLFNQLAMGWPMPLFFQDVRGELFLDVGGAFDRDNFNPWEAAGGGFELRDLKAGYGFGVRANMGLFLFRYDVAWPTDFSQTFHPKQYFSIDVTGLF